MYITTGTSTLLRRASSHASSSSSTAGKRLFKSLSNNPISNLSHSGADFGSGVSQYCRSFSVFRSVARWSHGDWKSPMSLTSQIRTTSVADSSTLLHRKIATMGCK